MKAEQIIDMQADLLRRLDPVEGTGLAEAIVATVNPQIPRSQAGRAQIAAQSLTRALRHGVQAAYAYRVDPDMTPLVIHAAASLDDSDKIDVSLAPTGCGIVRFDKPIPFREARGRTMLVHWIVWVPTRQAPEDRGTGPGWAGCAVYLFNDHNDPDEIARELLRDYPRIGERVGRWGFMGCDILADGHGVGPAENHATPEQAAQIIAEGDLPHPMTSTARIVHALWLLLNQTVVDVSEERMRRHASQVAASRGIPGRVSVIRLRRRADGQQHGESRVEWARRWIVRGHWRWQAYGPGRTERRRIWVHPFVKGPQDKPLVVPDKVYDLVR